MNLYHVQDGDRPMYVVAQTYGDAVRRWQAQIGIENECGDAEEPKGVALIAEGSDVNNFPELLLADDSKLERGSAS